MPRAALIRPKIAVLLLLSCLPRTAVAQSARQEKTFKLPAGAIGLAIGVRLPGNHPGGSDLQRPSRAHVVRPLRRTPTEFRRTRRAANGGAIFWRRPIAGRRVRERS